MKRQDARGTRRTCRWLLTGMSRETILKLVSSRTLRVMLIVCVVALITLEASLWMHFDSKSRSSRGELSMEHAFSTKDLFRNPFIDTAHSVKSGQTPQTYTASVGAIFQFSYTWGGNLDYGQTFTPGSLGAVYWFWGNHGAATSNNQGKNTVYYSGPATQTPSPTSAIVL